MSRGAAAAAEIAAALGRLLGEPGLASGTIGHLGEGGGDTTQIVDTGRRRVFVKRSPQPERLAAEADGLAALAACTALRLPAVFGIATLADGHGLLALEYLPLQERGDEAALGAAIAALHAVEGPGFGWSRHNYIGATPQANGWLDDWGRFMVERRLRPQLELAARNGAGDLGRRAEALLAALPGWFAAAPPRPALLHGDLWRGNVGFVAGRPAVFDPAVHYGDAEADIAMSELFGGFGPGFYAAYRERHPEAPGAARHRTLYRLYHVLNHFNLFGGGYAAQARALIDQWRAW